MRKKVIYVWSQNEWKEILSEQNLFQNVKFHSLWQKTFHLHFYHFKLPLVNFLPSL